MSVATEPFNRGHHLHGLPPTKVFPPYVKRIVLSPPASTNTPSIRLHTPLETVSAIDKIAAKPPTRTSTPKIPASPSPSKKTKSIDQRFTELVNVLQDFHQSGIDKPNATQVASALVRPNPKFYATKGFQRWGDFSLAAQSLGLVNIGGDPAKPGAQWIALRNAPQPEPKVEPLTTESLQGTPAERFTKLLQTLHEMNKKGMTCPALGAIARRMLHRDPKFYMKKGFDSWIAYVHAAESLGLVEIGLDIGTPGVLCISLGASPAASAKTSTPPFNVDQKNGPSTKQGPKYLKYRGPFWELVEILRRFQDEGSDTPYRLAVSSRLVRAFPDIYKTSGFAHWADYAAAAAGHGLVKLGGNKDAGLWISLL